MKKIFILFIALIGLWACGDDDNGGGGTTEPTDKFDPDKNYFPINSENWWDFEEYRFDVDGNILEDTKAEGRTTVGPDKIKDGATATVLMSKYNDDGGEDYSKYYYTDDDGNVWIHSDFVVAVLKNLADNSAFELPFEVTEPWLKIFDFKNASWDVHSESVANLQITEQISIESGEITLTGKQGISKSITVDGLKTTVHEFILHFDFTGKITGFSTDINLQFDMRHWLGGDAGILITSYDNAEFDLGSGDPIIFSGAESRVTKYYNADFVVK